MLLHSGDCFSSAWKTYPQKFAAMVRLSFIHSIDKHPFVP